MTATWRAPFVQVEPRRRLPKNGNLPSPGNLPSEAEALAVDLLNAVRQAFGTTHGEPSAATPDFNGRAMVDRVLAELAEHSGRVILVIDDAHELAST